MHLKTDAVIASNLFIVEQVGRIEDKLDSVLELLEQIRQEDAKLVIENEKLRTQHNSRFEKI